MDGNLKVGNKVKAAREIQARFFRIVDGAPGIVARVNDNGPALAPSYIVKFGAYHVEVSREEVAK
jgi:hypothetical protein